jgi:hypothetical protein
MRDVRPKLKPCEAIEGDSRDGGAVRTHHRE